MFYSSMHTYNASRAQGGVLGAQHGILTALSGVPRSAGPMGGGSSDSAGCPMPLTPACWLEAALSSGWPAGAPQAVSSHDMVRGCSTLQRLSSSIPATRFQAVAAAADLLWVSLLGLHKQTCGGLGVWWDATACMTIFCRTVSHLFFGQASAL